MDLFDRVLEFIIGCTFAARHFFPADIRRIKSSREFGAPQFFGNFLANKNSTANLTNGGG